MHAHGHHYKNIQDVVRDGIKVQKMKLFHSEALDMDPIHARCCTISCSIICYTLVGSIANAPH